MRNQAAAARAFDRAAARLKLIETLAVKEGVPDPDALRELATIHAALSAVREEIETHSARLGWGDSGELD